MNLNHGKVKFIIIAIVVVMVLAVGGYFLVKFLKSEPAGPDGPDVPPVVENKTASEKIIVDATISNTSDSKREIHISMPTFSNLSDYAFQQYINQRMNDTVKGYQNEINVVLDEDTPLTTKYRYNVDFNRYNNDDYISLVISQNYQTGGMRSNAWKDTYNVDVTKNTEIYLKDIFDATVDYKQEIISEINKQAEDKNYELVGGNGLSDIPETQKFYIKDGALVIYFDPAAIAPYVYGELHFEMPFEYKDGKFYVK